MDGKGQEILIEDYILSYYNILGSDNLCELSTLMLSWYRTNSGRSTNSNHHATLAKDLKRLAHGRLLLLVFVVE